MCNLAVRTSIHQGIIIIYSSSTKMAGGKMGLVKMWLLTHSGYLNKLASHAFTIVMKITTKLMYMYIMLLHTCYNQDSTIIICT